jgi:thiol-disulfide isomerase/thioredoxin
MNPRAALVYIVLTSAVCGACEKSEPAGHAGGASNRDPSGATAGAPGAATPEAGARGDVEIVAVAPGSEDVPSVVRRERAKAEASGRVLLVYVGASWCEPCTRFHRAVMAGHVRGQLPPTTLLEFDKDHDDDRLRAAGYASRLIPLFAVPATDGTASGKQIEGSIKGEGAVAEITPRLRGLIGAAGR